MEKQERLKIVTIGGGTGSFAILSELRRMKEEGVKLGISAVVAMSDSGGSTGVLMDQYGVLPAGDVRQCLVALSPQAEFLRKLFLYRYDDGFLSGHNFGNIFLSTVEKITNSFPQAIREAEKILNTQGKVYPVTFSKHQLVVEKKNGQKIISEKNLDYASLLDLEKIYLDGQVKLNPELIKIFKEADIVLISPGSFYTSILPNFLVPGFSELLEASQAKKIFITNMVTEKEQTDNYKVLDFVKKLEEFELFNNFDYIFYNNNFSLDNNILERYKKEGKFFVEINEKMKWKEAVLVAGDFLQKPKIDCQNKNFIRYDAKKLLKKVFEILENEK